MNVSILIGTFGDEHWERMALERALPSAQAQSGVYEVLRLHEADGTLCSVRNALAARARGDWLVFLDGDDELAPGFVFALNAAYQVWLGQNGREGIINELLTPAVVYLPERTARSRRLPNLRRARIWPEVDLRDGNWLVIGTAVPRGLFQKVGGFKDWPLYEDWCLWQRCSRAGATVVKVPQAVYVAYARNGSRNRVTKTQAEETHAAIRQANFPELYANA